MRWWDSCGIAQACSEAAGGGEPESDDSMFENLIMFAGLGGAVVPLVIHLLSRARYRTVPWGATMFLQGASPQRPHVGRLREWALLGVRMAAVGLLAVALARPVAGELTAAAEPGRVAAAIVIDCSGSMSRAEAGQTRMAMAQQAVLRILASLRRGDQVALVPAGGEPLNATFTGDLQAVATRTNELKPTAATADLADAIATALDALQQQEASRRLYVVSDRQALSWSRIGDDAAAALRARVTRLESDFVLIPVGSNDQICEESPAIRRVASWSGATKTSRVGRLRSRAIAIPEK